MSLFGKDGIIATIVVLFVFFGIGFLTIKSALNSEDKKESYEALQIEKVKLEIMILKKQCEGK